MLFAKVVLQSILFGSVCHLFKFYLGGRSRQVEDVLCLAIKIRWRLAIAKRLVCNYQRGPRTDCCCCCVFRSPLVKTEVSSHTCFLFCQFTRPLLNRLKHMIYFSALNYTFFLVRINHSLLFLEQDLLLMKKLNAANHH